MGAVVRVRLTSKIVLGLNLLLLGKMVFLKFFSSMVNQSPEVYICSFFGPIFAPIL